MTFSKQAYYLSVILLLGCFSSIPPAAAADHKTPTEIYDIAKDFAMCSALYDALKDVAKREGDPDTAEVFNGLSNGAEFVAGAIAKTYGGVSNEKTFVAGIYDTELPFIRTIIKHQGVKDKDIAIRLNTCKALNPLQTQMVDELRKKAYGTDTTQNQFFK